MFPCNSAFERGTLELWRCRNAFIIITTTISVLLILIVVTAMKLHIYFSKSD